ncbi:MAG TPA: hypothetical protein VGR81_02255 [Candidatus Acidoferrales bacterium]|nr:hypothetical protein [Candidatus Acidoferrales bacterium]
MLCVIIILALTGHARAQEVPPSSVAPAHMPKVGTVDRRFVSYNVEMVEVTGGRFWKPYSTDEEARQDAKVVSSKPSSQISADLFQYRPPIDLANFRLRNLAKAIGPAYIRVSGGWANGTYFQDDDKPPLKQPPAGFKDVLTRAEWKGVIEFARAAGAQIVTSFSISPGTRGSDGVWMPTQAKALLDYTNAIGGRIAAAEFMNEPNLVKGQGAPSYDAAAFAKDIKIFMPFYRSQLSKSLLVGPGTGTVGNEKVLKLTGPIFDVFSYHFYGALSRRCTTGGRGRGITIDQVLSPEWLDRTDQAEASNASLRDTYLPGKPIWLTETAEAACGGDMFAGQFADTFRFLNQFGTLARKGVQVVMHNTLAGSDYGLLDEETFQPRPNYWAAVLWNRTMGTTVLDPETKNEGALRIYAHCMKQTRGGVALLALNTDEKEEYTLEEPVSGDRFTLTAPALTSTIVLLNGRELEANPNGSLPSMQGQPFKAGPVRLPPHSITFLTIPSAGNNNCQ